jgi:hypothetical protein
MIAALSLLFAAPALARDVSIAPGVDAPPPAPSGPAAAPETSAKSGGGGNPNGAVTQTCTDSCNRTYEICMDQESAIPGNGDTMHYNNNVANRLIGTSSDCFDHLRSCLNECGG